MLNLAPRPDFTKREGSPWPKCVSFASGAGDWPFAAHSAPAPAPAATPANAAALLRNRLRPDLGESLLESMIASRHECPMKLDVGRFEHCRGPNIHLPTDSLVSGIFNSVSIGPPLRLSSPRGVAGHHVV